MTPIIRGAVLAFSLAVGSSAESATPDWSKWADLQAAVQVISTDEGGRTRTTTFWIVVVDGQAYLRTGRTTWGRNVEREGKLKLKGEPGECQFRAERITDPSLEEKGDGGVSGEVWLPRRDLWCDSFRPAPYLSALGVVSGGCLVLDVSLR